MLPPSYLDQMPDAFVQLWQQVEDEILQDVARRIGKMDAVTPTKVSLQINKNHFQVNVTQDDKTKIYYYGNSNIELDPNALNDYEAKTSVSPVLTVKIDDLASADKIEVVYIPKLWAKDSLTDSYSDVYGTWDITEAIKGSL